MGGRGALHAFLFASVLYVAIACVPAAGSKAPPSKPKISAPESPALPLALSGNSNNARPSSAVFRVHGVVYPHGGFYVNMNIGVPPKPYFLEIDTGSDLTWLECDAPCVKCIRGPHPWYRPRKGTLVKRHDPLCDAVQLIAPPSHRPPPMTTSDKCVYEFHYADLSNTTGFLLDDVFAMSLVNKSVVRPALAFGCGYDQHFPSKGNPAKTDGMLGLGNGKVSVLSQLSGQKVTRNVMGHCLGSSGKSGSLGYLFFGDDLIPRTGMTWVPMSRVHSQYIYSAGSADLNFGAQPLGVRRMNVFLDTGATYSYFEPQSYRSFLTAVKKDVSKTPLKEVQGREDPELKVCWKGQRPFKTVNDVKSYFKTLTLVFVNGNGAPFHVPPENYLIVTKDGNACLGILNGAEAGVTNYNLLGDVSLQDIMVAYDNENKRIGWIQTACNKLPNAEDNNERRPPHLSSPPWDGVH